MIRGCVTLSKFLYYLSSNADSIMPRPPNRVGRGKRLLIRLSVRGRLVIAGDELRVNCVFQRTDDLRRMAIASGYVCPSYKTQEVKAAYAASGCVSAISDNRSISCFHDYTLL